MKEWFVYFLNIGLALASMLRNIVLNILGAGGIWGLKSVIQSYDENYQLNAVFRPIYYTSLGLLSLWQILEWTIGSKNQYNQEIEDETIAQPTLAHKYPVHFLFDQFKRCCSYRRNNAQAPSTELTQNRATLDL